MWLRSACVALGVGVLTCFGVVTSRVQAAPTDPFSDAAPSFDKAPEDPVGDDVGDWGVAEQRGAATYTLPIRLPQGRNGMAPSLALRYSSRSPLRGGLAVGWTLDLASVAVDRSVGVEDERTFRASLGNASGRLVRVPDQAPFGGVAYRAEFDDSFTRFFHVRPNEPLHAHWIALTADGVKHFFGNQRFSGDGETEWLLTRQVDPFGNTVHYTRERVTSGRYVEDAIKRIEYASNRVAGLPAYARVEFIYAPPDLCPGSMMPIGARPDGSSRITHTRRMVEIQVLVRDEPTEAFRLSQRLSLKYVLRNSVLHQAVLATNGSGASCAQNPLRYLTQVQITAFNAQGSPAVAPAVTFHYNARRQVLAGTPPCVPGGACNEEHRVATPAHGHHGTLNGATGTRLDLDSDGLPDLVSSVEENGFCTLVWRKGQLEASFEGAQRTSRLPTAPWHHQGYSQERCTLNGQTVARDRPHNRRQAGGTGRSSATTSWITRVTEGSTC